MEGEKIKCVKNIYAFNFRIAHERIGASELVLSDIYVNGEVKNTLIISPPGCGKTTLLRDLARQIAINQCVSVVDERGEVFPPGIPKGIRMDVLTGSPKPEGMEMVLRCMSPDWIAVDEISSESDCAAIRKAVGCGVRFLASAHASSREDLYARPIYRPLVELGIFQYLCILRKDKSFRTERIGL